MTKSQGVLGIDHVQVAVPPGCEEECRAFYVRVLGLPELPKPPALAARGGIWVQAGTHELHCGVDQDFQPARKAHPAFAVADIAALAARIDGTGYGIAWDTTNPAIRRFFTHDPFGNRLEFVAAASAPTTP